MTKPEFIALIGEWSKAWEVMRESGEPGFGSETTLDDWLGSIDSYVGLQESLVYDERDYADEQLAIERDEMRNE